MPPILLAAISFVSLFLLCCAFGRRLLIWVRIDDLTPLERITISLALGLGALHFVSFALFAAHIATPLIFRVTLTLLALALIMDITSTLRDVRDLRPRSALLGWQRVCLTFVAAAALVTFLAAACPVTDSDGLSYHLAAANRWLQAGGFVYLPTLTYTNWPSCVETLFATLVAVHPDIPPALVQYLFGLIGISAAYCNGRVAGGRAAGIVASTTMLAYAVYWEEMTHAEVDLGTTAFASTAILCVQLSQSRNCRRLLVLAAALAGLAASTKLNGVWVIISLMLVTALTPRMSSRTDDAGRETADPPRMRASRALLLGLIAFLVVAPWLIKSWIVASNPVYPVGFNLFGGREWTAEGWPRIQHYFLLMTIPWGMAPTRMNAMIGRLTIAAVFLLPALIVFPRTRRSIVAVPARFAALFALCISVGSGYNLRFLQPGYPGACAAFGSWLGERAGRAAWIVCLVTALLGFRVCKNVLGKNALAIVRYNVGAITRDEYLTERLPDYPIVQVANATLPPRSRLLICTWEEATAYYRPYAYRPNYWLQDSIHYDTQERLIGDLRRLRITHLVLTQNEEWCSRSEICKGRNEHETRALTRLAEERGALLAQRGAYSFYRLNLEPRR